MDDINSNATPTSTDVHGQLAKVSDSALGYIRIELDNHKNLVAKVTAMKSELDSLHSELTTIGTIGNKAVQFAEEEAETLFGIDATKFRRWGYGLIAIGALGIILKIIF